MYGWSGQTTEIGGLVYFLKDRELSPYVLRQWTRTNWTFGCKDLLMTHGGKMVSIFYFLQQYEEIEAEKGRENMFFKFKIYIRIQPPPPPTTLWQGSREEYRRPETNLFNDIAFSRFWMLWWKREFEKAWMLLYIQRICIILS